MTLREYLYRENIIPSDPDFINSVRNVFVDDQIIPEADINDYLDNELLNVVKETSFIHSSFVFVFYDFDLSSILIYQVKLLIQRSFFHE